MNDREEKQAPSGQQKVTGNGRFRRLEINGGTVTEDSSLRFQLRPISYGYGNAQIDDYGLGHEGKGRRHYPWRPEVRLYCRARFSHPTHVLQGTAGFGFWNAPIGDPTIPWPALPQAVWFFHASAPTDLPLAPSGPGRGWFVATIDAATLPALALAPLAPLVLLLNQFPRLRQRIWPAVQRRLGIRYHQLDADITEWHEYELVWGHEACWFYLDGAMVFQTDCSPHGPLGLVCWLDNQYLVVTSRGRLAWGVLPTGETQWLEVKDLQVGRR